MSFDDCFDVTPDCRLNFLLAHNWDSDRIASYLSPWFRSSAPEVLTRQAVDEKVDMWALGVVMWVVLTGRHPFDAGVNLSEEEVVRRLAEQEPDLRVRGVSAYSMALYSGHGGEGSGVCVCSLSCMAIVV